MESSSKERTSNRSRRVPIAFLPPSPLYANASRRGGTDEELASYIRRVVMRKEARHHIGEPGFEKPSRNRVHIGG
jgi:hypothetical protein